MSVRDQGLDNLDDETIDAIQAGLRQREAEPPAVLRCRLCHRTDVERDQRVLSRPKTRFEAAHFEALFFACPDHGHGAIETVWPPGTKPRGLRRYALHRAVRSWCNRTSNQ